MSTNPFDGLFGDTDPNKVDIAQQEDNENMADDGVFFDDDVDVDESSPTVLVQDYSPEVQKNLDIFYSRLEDMGMNLNELRPILDCDDTMLALAGAGAGKTTMLNLYLIKNLISGKMMKTRRIQTVYGDTLVQMPANILISTFLRSGAQELQESFRTWCLKLGLSGIDHTTINFRTIDAEVYSALKDMGVRVEILEDEISLIRQVMRDLNIRSNNSTTRSASIDEVTDVAQIISYARNRLDDKRFDQPLMQEYNIDALMLSLMLENYQKLRRLSGKQDFADLSEMLLEAVMLNPNVKQFIENRYDFVLVDEFQDTSQLQYELLKVYFGGAERILAVGDDDQTIYSWRGSDINIITTRFEEDYKPVIKQLTTNYRCGANILNPIIPSIEKNSNRHPKRLRAHREGGEVNVVMNGDVNHLFESIKTDLLEKRSVGVVARVNADLLIPAMILELDGNVNFSISKSVTMNNRMGKQVFGVIELLTKRYTESFEEQLRIFLPRKFWYEAEKVSNVLMANRSYTLYNLPLEDLEKSVPNLYPFLEGLFTASKVSPVEGYTYILSYMAQYVFTGDSLYAKKAKDLVYFVKRLIEEHNILKGKSIHEIEMLFKDILPDKLSNRARYAGKADVKLTTVHDAKGKEWDSVYIWNNVDGAFPNVVGGRDLTDDEYEEERRVHYIAWTRAKNKLTVYTDPLRMGDFLKECDMSVVKEVVENPPLESTKVYRKPVEPAEEIVNADKLLDSYIKDVGEDTVSATDERVNLSFVLSKWGKDDVLMDLVDSYGEDDLPSLLTKDFLDEYFDRLATRLVAETQTL